MENINQKKAPEPRPISFEHLKDLRDVNLDLTNTEPDDNDEILALEDTLPDTGSGLSVEDQALEGPRREQLNKVLNLYLPPRERQIIHMRFGLDTGTPMTLDSIGKHFGVSRERITQLEKRALHTLRINAGNILREVWDEDGHWVMEPSDKAMGLSDRIKLSEAEKSTLNLNN